MNVCNNVCTYIYVCIHYTTVAILLTPNAPNGLKLSTIIPSRYLRPEAGMGDSIVPFGCAVGTGTRAQCQLMNLHLLEICARAPCVFLQLAPHMGVPNHQAAA